MPRTAATRRAVNNLLVNGDFEYAPAFTASTTANSVWIDGSAAGSATNGVYKWGMGPGAQSGSWAVKFDTAESYTGTTSMKLSTTAVSSSLAVGRVIAASSAGIAYATPIVAGTSYTYSFMMKTNYTSGDSNDGAFVIVRSRNSSGSTVTTSTSTKVKTTTGWTLYTGTITPGAGSAVLDVQLSITGASGAGTLIMDAWFDDVVVGHTSPLTRLSA